MDQKELNMNVALKDTTSIACEECGGIGERRSGGWIRTLCDKHETLYQVSKGNYNEESK
jgi:hypothetical protein